MKINASDMPRYMQCRGAFKLAPLAPKIEREQSQSRIESEAARYALHIALTDPNKLVVGEKCSNGYILTAEMVDHVSAIASMISHRDMDATLWPQKSVNVSIGNLEIDGNIECVGWNDQTRTLYIDEMKYGWRIVEVSNNWHLISYALAMFIGYGCAFDQVVMTIHQPRPHHPDGPTRSVTMTRDQIAAAHTKILAEMSDACQTGPECYGCGAAMICPSAEKAAYAAIDASMIATSDDVDGGTLGFELIMLERAEEAIKIRKKALDELATHRIKNGEHVAHWTLKNSLSNRKWLDGITADVVKSMSGVDVSDVGIITPSQAEKRGVNKSVIESLTERKSTGFKLVRQDINSVFKKEQ